MNKFSFVALTCVLAAASQAATLTINFNADNNLTSTSGAAGNALGIVSQLTLTDAGANTVTGTISNLFSATGQKLDYLRIFAYDYPEGTPTVTSADSVFDSNGNKSKWGSVNDASNTYNLTVGFKNSGPNNLGANDSMSFTLTGTGLDVSDFLSSNGDVMAMIHVLSVPGSGNSVKLGGEPVPEPASMAALGFGAVAMLRRRKKA